MDDLCPGCGSSFEPAGKLAELVDFRAIAAQARREADRRVDDRGPVTAQAVALPRPETTC
jgi:hypothetical protein